MSLQQRHGDTVSRHLMGIDGQENVTTTPCQLYGGPTGPPTVSAPRVSSDATFARCHSTEQRARRIPSYA